MSNAKMDTLFDIKEAILTKFELNWGIRIVFYIFLFISQYDVTFHDISIHIDYNKI